MTQNRVRLVYGAQVEFIGAVAKPVGLQQPPEPDRASQRNHFLAHPSSWPFR